MSVYTAPQLAPVGAFKSVTNGLWFGRFRDVIAGKAITLIRY